MVRREAEEQRRQLWQDASAKPAPADEYARGSIQLYRNAKREGVSV